MDPVGDPWFESPNGSGAYDQWNYDITSTDENTFGVAPTNEGTFELQEDDEHALAAAHGAQQLA